MRRMCSAGRASPLRWPPSGSVLLFLGLRASDLTVTQKQRPSGQPFLERFLDRSDNKYILVQFTVEKQLAKPFR